MTCRSIQSNTTRDDVKRRNSVNITHTTQFHNTVKEFSRDDVNILLTFPTRWRISMPIFGRRNTRRIRFRSYTFLSISWKTYNRLEIIFFIIDYANLSDMNVIKQYYCRLTIRLSYLFLNLFLKIAIYNFILWEIPTILYLLTFLN